MSLNVVVRFEIHIITNHARLNYRYVLIKTSNKIRPSLPHSKKIDNINLILLETKETHKHITSTTIYMTNIYHIYIKDIFHKSKIESN